MTTMSCLPCTEPQQKRRTLMDGHDCPLPPGPTPGTDLKRGSLVNRRDRDSDRDREYGGRERPLLVGVAASSWNAPQAYKGRYPRQGRGW